MWELTREGQKVSLSRLLRRNSTKAERALWRRLRDRHFNGRKFRRQYPVGPYVVDFCCPELRLIVEIDGDVHMLKKADDVARQAVLERLGYRVVRFTNRQVLYNPGHVVDTLAGVTKPETPSP